MWENTKQNNYDCGQFLRNDVFSKKNWFGMIAVPSLLFKLFRLLEIEQKYTGTNIKSFQIKSLRRIIRYELI